MSDYFSARVIADSVHDAHDFTRLTTLELTFPRFILSEFNTHRVFSRNSASSRAIPVIKQVERVLRSPFIPEQFGVNQPGMQAGIFLEGESKEEAVQSWLDARNSAVASVAALLLGSDKQIVRAIKADSTRLYREEFVESLLEALKEYDRQIKASRVDGSEHGYLNVHKQTANRLIEPFTWHTVLVTATEWDNFWGQRDNKNAQPEIEKIAHLAHAVYQASVPTPLTTYQWHLPLLQDDEKELALEDPERWRKIVVGRCARVSYENHNGVRDPEADIRLFERLVKERHMSPLEHVAYPVHADYPRHPDLPEFKWFGNFRGWKQWRKSFPYEDNYAEFLKHSE